MDLPFDRSAGYANWAAAHDAAQGVLKCKHNDSSGEVTPSDGGLEWLNIDQVDGQADCPHVHTAPYSWCIILTAGSMYP